MQYDEQLTCSIKKLAKDRDVDLVGVASIDRFEGAPKGFHPKDLLRTTQSIIVIARRFSQPACAHHQKWNRSDQQCKEPCGLCIQVCPLGKETNE